MDLDQCSFRELSFSKLYNDYVNQQQSITSFFEYPPLEPASYKQRAQQLNGPQDRGAAVDALVEFNQSLGLNQQVLDNLEPLRREDAVAVVTGQQTSLYGGPLYTIFKTLTVIKMAQWLEDELGQPVVPVFWLGDEDHDFDEMRSIHLPSREQEVRTFSLPENEEHHEAVSQMELGEAFGELRKELGKELRDTDFSEHMWDLLDRWYQPGSTMGQAFAGVLSELFAKHGLAMAGSHHPAVKQLLKQPMKTAVAEYENIYKQLEERSSALADHYHQQVKLYESNLFYHDPENGRLKISEPDDGTWTAGERSWSTDKLLEDIEKHPERFSPNVFLRPILQDELLPTVAYVGGPGEVAYYGQTQSFYEVFGRKMPIIVPRLSATLIESGIARIMEKLPFRFPEYGRRIEDLEKDFVQQRENNFDIEQFFKDWKEKTEDLSEEKAGAIEEVDPTLVKAAGKATAAYFNELDQLKGKVYRSTKQQEKTQLNRIRRIKHHCFPGDGLQERTYSMLYYMNKYGVDIWDRILDLEGNPPFYREHHLVNL